MLSNSLPTIMRGVDIPRLLKTWQTKLAQAVQQQINSPRAPWNFKATSARGGIQLAWSPVDGADGYQIIRSSSGDLSNPDATYNLPGQQQNSYFDALPTSQSVPTLKKYYKIRATSGTSSNPQTVFGVFSGIVSQTSIATNDTTTAPVSTPDTTLTDGLQTGAGRGGGLTIITPQGKLVV